MADNNIVKDEFVLFLSVYTRTWLQILSMVAENIEVANNAMLFKYQCDVIGLQVANAWQACLTKKLVLNASWAIQRGSFCDVNAYILQEK